MNTNSHSVARWFLIAMILKLAGCSPDLSDDAIPLVSFPDIVINLTLPAYVDLNSDKGFKYAGGGVRGIILYNFGGNIYAYERNCSFHPNEAGSTVEVHSSHLYFFDPSCGSSFDIPAGNPSGGQAWRPLRQYQTTRSGSTLTITDAIIN